MSNEDTVAVDSLSGLPGLLRRLTRRIKAKLKTSIVPIGFGALTLVLGTLGWGWKLYDGTLHSVAVIAFKAFGDFAPSIKNLDDGNRLTDLAALCGLLTLYASIAVVGLSLFREHHHKLLARYIYTSHHIVVGDTALAERASVIWRSKDRRTLQVLASEAAAPTFKRRAVRLALDESLMSTAALPKAHRVFIDLDNDATTLALALRLFGALATALPPRRHRRGAPDSRDKSAEWLVVIRDARFADYLTEKMRTLGSRSGARPLLPAICVLSPERLIARQVLAQHPAFLLPVGASRAHMVIVGYDRLGAHLAERLYQSALVVGQQRPIVTVLTAQATLHRKRFLAQTASLYDEIDVVFLEAECLDDFMTGATPDAGVFRERDAAHPVTSIFLTSEQIYENIATSISIQAIQRRTARLRCKVFVREGKAEESMLALAFASALGRRRPFSDVRPFRRLSEDAAL